MVGPEKCLILKCTAGMFLLLFCQPLGSVWYTLALQICPSRQNALSSPVDLNCAIYCFRQFSFDALSQHWKQFALFFCLLGWFAGLGWGFLVFFLVFWGVFLLISYV